MSTPAEKDVFVVESYGGHHWIAGVFLDRELAANFAAHASKRGVSMKVTGYKLDEIPEDWKKEFP